MHRHGRSLQTDPSSTSMANTTSTPDPLDTFGLVPTAVGAVHGTALNAAFLSFDVCLATAFVLFSTPSERRSAIFWLHIFSFGCAGAFFFIQIGTQPSQILLIASQRPDGGYALGVSLDVARCECTSTTRGSDETLICYNRERGKLLFPLFCSFGG